MISSCFTLTSPPPNSVSIHQERRSEDQCHYAESYRNQAVLTDLRRATQYEVQVRARTLAGYGSFSPAAYFRTLPDGTAALEEAVSHTHYSFTHFFFFISFGKVFQILFKSLHNFILNECLACVLVLS